MARFLRLNIADIPQHAFNVAITVVRVSLLMKIMRFTLIKDTKAHENQMLCPIDGFIIAFLCIFFAGLGLRFCSLFWHQVVGLRTSAPTYQFIEETNGSIHLTSIVLNSRWITAFAVMTVCFIFAFLSAFFAGLALRFPP